MNGFLFVPHWNEYDLWHQPILKRAIVSGSPVCIRVSHDVTRHPVLELVNKCKLCSSTNGNQYSYITLGKVDLLFLISHFQDLKAGGQSSFITDFHYSARY